MPSRPSTTARRRPLRMPLLALAAALSASLVTSCSGDPSPGSGPPAATAASPPSAGTPDRCTTRSRSCCATACGGTASPTPSSPRRGVRRGPLPVRGRRRRLGPPSRLRRRPRPTGGAPRRRRPEPRLLRESAARPQGAGAGGVQRAVAARAVGPSAGRRGAAAQRPGCVAEAERSLYGDHGAWFRASARVDALDRIRRGRVAAEPAYGAGLRAWSRCMRKAGHSYTTPVAARAAATGPKHPLPRDREVALALAEAACAASSGLGATARRLDARHGAALRAEYRADVDTRDRLRARALTRARQILRAHGAP
ncbi:hypothetical protein ACFQ60_19790 [Streptomyces zhihengii]